MAVTTGTSSNRYIYFRPKSRKVCPSCMRKIADKRVWSLCEFIQEAGQWADLVIFCERCYTRVALQRLQLESRGKQYRIVYVAVRGDVLPHWLQFSPGDASL